MSSSFFCVACGAALPTGTHSCPGCGHMQSVQPKAITAFTANFVLARRYRILTKIGEGGFGHVYKARDIKNGRLVAIKRIALASLNARQIIEATDSYNREITLLAGLRHQHLPRLYAHFTDSENWYIVLEYIKGRTLEKLLESSPAGRLPTRQALEIGKALCGVLGYLHRQQPPIIYRDVKPANIMMTRLRRIYLIDFGIARRYREGQRKDTGALGSPGYAAPEQYGSAQTTPQSDIYSLGVTLQTLLTGRGPDEILSAGMPSDCVIPEDVQALITQMTQPEIFKRPLTMIEVEDALQLLLRKTSQPSPFTSLALLWCLLMMVLSGFCFHTFISSAIFTVLLALLLIVMSCIYVQRAELLVARRLTFKESLQAINQGLSNSRWLIQVVGYALCWSMFSAFALENFLSQLSRILPPMLLMIVTISTTFFIMKGLPRLIKRWQKIKAKREQQTSVTLPPMQQHIHTP